MGKLSKGARFLEPALLLIDDLERPNKIAGHLCQGLGICQDTSKDFLGIARRWAGRAADGLTGQPLLMEAALGMSPQRRFFGGPPCDGRASTITCFAHIVKLHCSHCMASFKFFRRYCTPTKHPVHRFSLNNSVLKLKIPGILMPVSRYGGYRPGVGVTGLTSAEKRARIKPHSISWSGTLLLPSN